MSEANRCAECGGELASDAPQGLCPGCLLKRGLETNTFPTGGESPATDQVPPPTPAELAAYFPDLEILELVGRGGMGVVYKARQKRLDRLVALKILSPKIAQDPAFAERFAREARAMAMLSHPHIVAVHDFGQTRGEGRGDRGEGTEEPSRLAAASTRREAESGGKGDSPHLPERPFGCFAHRGTVPFSAKRTRRSHRSAEIMHHDDMRMAKHGHRLRFPVKPFGEGGVMSDLGREDLQGHEPIEPFLPGFVDHAHATAADQF